MPSCSQQYCGQCFAMYPAGDACCPRCTTPAAALSFRDYQGKLVHALEHPLADVRMRAIIALGLRGEGKAAQALVDCALRHPTDVTEGLQIVHSLQAMLAGTGDMAPLERLVREHPGHAVQLAVLRVLGRIGPKTPSSPGAMP
jgi:hypothetical protein